MEIKRRDAGHDLPGVRNLIYHVTPTGNWKFNIDLLREHWDLFNGKRIIAVVEDKSFDSNAKSVKQYLPPGDCEILLCQNDKDLRESATLLDLLLTVHSFKPEEYTCYAHTKGVTHQAKKTKDAVMLWTHALYSYNMARYADVHALLQIYPVVGSFAKYGKFKHFPKGSTWHYSGTFYWFRNRDLFRRDWYGDHIPIERYTAEAYPGLMFGADEMGVVAFNNVKNLYDYRYLNDLLNGKIKSKKSSARSRSIAP